MKLLLDEMYPPALAEALRAGGIEASTVVEQGLNGRSDPDVLAAAAAEGYVVLTENVADFARIATERLNAGGHHAGVLIALSSRFSRRPSGIHKIAAAIRALAEEELEDRLVYLQQPSQRREPIGRQDHLRRVAEPHSGPPGIESRFAPSSRSAPRNEPSAKSIVVGDPTRIEVGEAFGDRL